MFSISSSLRFSLIENQLIDLSLTMLRYCEMVSRNIFANRPNVSFSHHSNWFHFIIYFTWSQFFSTQKGSYLQIPSPISSHTIMKKECIKWNPSNAADLEEAAHWFDSDFHNRMVLTCSAVQKIMLTSH
jgi:hypothetical protein